MPYAAAVALTAGAADAQSAPPDAAFAGAIYAEACVKTHPSYGRATRVLRANNFNSQGDGLWAHERSAMTVKVRRGRECSLLARISGTAERFTQSFIRTVAQRAVDARVTVVSASTQAPGGSVFFGAGIPR